MPARVSRIATELGIDLDRHGVTPEGKIVQLKVNQPLTLEISADQPGELHVHSTPERTISYPKGQSSWELEIPRPGVVEIEDHHSGALVFKLQVR